MVRPNNKRLETVLSNCTEAIKKLETTREQLGKRKIDSARIDVDTEYLEVLSELITAYQDVFRANVINLFTSIEEYIAMSLRQSHVSVSSKSVSDCLKLCKDNNYISEELYEVHIKSLRHRNNIVHRYDEPTSEELQKWWEVNREQYLKFSDFVANESAFREVLKSMSFF